MAPDIYRLVNGCDVLLKLEFEVHTLVLKLHPITPKIFITLTTCPPGGS